MKRTQAIMIREVTGQLPHLPDQAITDKVNEPHPYQRGRWFYVELHLGNYGLYGPAALGVVSVNDGDEDYDRAELVSMFVEDCVRGGGYGTQIIEAAGARWPNLIWTDGPGSLHFHENLVERGVSYLIPHGAGYYQFIPKGDR